MSGELAQLIALVGYGNRFLAGGGDAPSLLTGNTTFQFVRSLEFVACGRGRPPGLHDTSSWFEWLAEESVQRLLVEIRVGTDPNLVAFANSGAWSVVAVSPRSTTRWIPTWSVVVDPHAGESRIWAVTYRCRRSRRPARREPDLTRATDTLRMAIEGAREFARSSGAQLSLFADWLVAARMLLEAERPLPPYHPDMLPESTYDLDARRLVAAASRARVFGGMGSWNDVWFDDRRTQHEYVRVTRTLFRAVLSALATGANAFETSTRKAV